MKIFERLQLVNEMITQLVVCYYNYFKNYLIAIDLSKRQALDVDPKAIQQINFSENIERF